MGNTRDERIRFQSALSRVCEKFEFWLRSNRHLESLQFATDDHFDKIIHFMDPMEFHLFLMSRKFEKTAGCSVAAMTISGLHDDEMPDYQRRIHYNRAMLTDHTIIHEIFHFLCHARFTRELKTPIVEGFTEYFTHKVVGPRGSAAAAAALTDDSGKERQSGYDEMIRTVDQTRKFLKESIIPFIKANRQFATFEMPAPAAAVDAARARRGGVKLDPLELRRELAGFQAQTSDKKWNRAAPSTLQDRRGLLGRAKDQQFMADDYGGVSLKNFSKRAYLLGDENMVKLIKQQT